MAENLKSRRHWWIRFLKVASASVLVLFVMTGAILYHNVDSHVESFSTQLDRNAEVVKERVNSVLTHADGFISHTKNAYEQHGSGFLQNDLNLNRVISDISRRDHLGTAIWSEDASIIETTNPSMAMYSADRILNKHAHSDSDKAHLSCQSPVQFFLSKRINDSQGNFHGVVATELSGHRFNLVTKGLSLSSHNRFTVSHGDHPHDLPNAVSAADFYADSFGSFIFKHLLRIDSIVETNKDLPYDFALKSEGNVHQYLSMKLREETGLLALFVTSVIFLVWISARIADRESELRRRELDAKRNSMTDDLTGFLNRRGLIQHFPGRQNPNDTKPYALICIDVDRFKLINDTMGHMVGDEMLRIISRRIQRVLNANDVAVRLGGDEFAIVVAQHDNDIDNYDRRIDTATKLANRIVESFKNPITVFEHRIRTTVSIGIACFPEHGDSLATVLNASDNALYAAKADGRDRSRVFESSMQLKANEELVISQALHNSLRNDELSVFFQPILSASTNKVVSLEALVRWYHPVWGVVAPDKFIPVAEKFRMIVPIGDFVFEQACKYLLQLPKQISVSINVSVVQLQEISIVDKFLETTNQLGVNPKRIILEITETVILHDDKTVISQINTFREHGIKIALDDFGTGFSTLSHLTQFPLDKIKIDRSFINDIGTNNGHRVLVKKLIELSHELDMQITAEGVETNEQANILADFHCHEYQGYYFSRPAPHTELDILEIERRASEKSELAA